MSVQRPQLQDKLLRYIFSCVPNLNTKFDRNDCSALFALENYSGYNNCFFSGSFSTSHFFLAAFQLVLKIFSVAAKFSGLASKHGQGKAPYEKRFQCIFSLKDTI